MMKKIIAVGTMITLVLIAGTIASAQTAEEILVGIDNSQNTETSFSTNIMRIYNDRNDTSDYIEHTTRGFSRGHDTSYSEYVSPASIAGIKVLSTDDMIYVYFSASGRARPVADNRRNSSPTGAGDFNYQDMAAGSLAEDYTAEIVVEDVTYWVLDCVPLDESNPYEKIRMKVRKTDYRVDQINYYDEEGLIKYMQLQDYQEVIGQSTGASYSIPSRVVMVNVRRDTMTVVITSSIQVDIPVSDCYFDPTQLEYSCD